MPVIGDIAQILTRDIRALARQVDAYGDEAQLWVTPGGVPNSAGNLVMHLCGNLRHFIGHGLGHSGYVRNREFEFSAKNQSRHQLHQLIDATAKEVESALNNLNDDQLGEPYPTPPGGRAMTIGLFLVHLSAHLGYHLGQIDYHRRMVTGDSAGTDAVSVSEIGS